MASASFAVMNALIKLAAPGHPLAVGVWARYVTHVVIVLAVIAVAERSVRGLTAAHLRGQILRGWFLLGSTALSFVALALLPLPEATAIFLTGPVMITILAVPLLRERAGPAQWTGLAAAFLGATLIIRPGTGVFTWAAFVPLGATLSDSLYQIVTRRMRHRDSPMTTLFYAGLVGAVVMTFVVLLHPEELTAANILPFIPVGVMGAVAHLTLMLALRSAPVGIVAPIAYLGLVWATVIGAVLFQSTPDAVSIVGMAAIAAAGLWAVRSGQRPDLASPAAAASSTRAGADHPG